jgi:dihydroorotate dehydrogenase
LAAGYDKDASAVRGLSTLGFGHIEVGTVTPLAQPGNPYPRVFRLPEDQAVINRMGFPSAGSAKVVKNLNKLGRCHYAPTMPKRVINTRGFFSEGKRRKSKSKVILGVNIGKNKDTPNEEAVLDYLSLLELFAPCADYLTINISSPNTVGLRDLQGREALEMLLAQLDRQRQMERCGSSSNRQKSGWADPHHQCGRHHVSQRCKTPPRHGGDVDPALYRADL